MGVPDRQYLLLRFRPVFLRFRSLPADTRPEDLSTLGFDVMVSVAVIATWAAFTPLAAQMPSPSTAFGIEV